ncbi:hypothetical protein ILUMI_06144 [Ignelater luminosus]|uniref:Uncharacterized protein n=1 Tax=Ignelater luminosus TaxID=2038154 RepID=A0A8K0DG74_IGNLU|nr:hypothetical protein ILUMI_06144 [Ignelater luminosus]
MGCKICKLQETTPTEVQCFRYKKLKESVEENVKFISDNPGKASDNKLDDLMKILREICTSYANEEDAQELVEKLIRAKPDVIDYPSDAINNCKRAIHYAALSENPKILKVITNKIKEGHENRMNSLSNGNTALNLLIKEKKMKEEEMKKEGKKEADENEETEGFIRCVDVLLTADIDVNISDNKNLTPIFWAVKYKYYETVKIILWKSKYEVDVAKVYISQYILDEVQSNSEQKNREKERKPFNKLEVLFGFLKEGDETSFNKSEYLQDSKVLNGNNGEFTLLQFATRRKFTKAVENLLKKGAKPDKNTAITKTTPLEIAAEMGYFEIFELFLQNINRKNTEPTESTEPTEFAESTKSIESIFLDVLKIIIKKCDNKRPDADYKSFYFLLLKNIKNKCGIVNKIIDEENKNTALYYSVNYGHPEITLDLLRAGESMASKNKLGVYSVESLDFDTLQTHLDECLEVNQIDNIYETDFTAKYNYKTLMSPLDNSDKEPETKVISLIRESVELRSLLEHPVITSFLYIKWQRIRRYFYINLAFQFAFFLSLTVYVYNNQNNNKNKVADSILLGVTCGIFTFLFLRELVLILLAVNVYCRSWLNLLDVALLILTPVIILQISLMETFKNEVSYFVLSLAALKLVVLVGKEPHMFIIVTILCKFIAVLVDTNEKLIESTARLFGQIGRLNFIVYMEKVIGKSSLPETLASKCIVWKILEQSVYFVYFDKRLCMEIYPNRQAQVIATTVKTIDNKKYKDSTNTKPATETSEEDNKEGKDGTNIYLDAHIAIKTKQLIRKKQEAEMQKNKKQKEEEQCNEKYKMVIKKLDFILVNIEKLECDRKQIQRASS